MLWMHRLESNVKHINALNRSEYAVHLAPSHTTFHQYNLNFHTETGNVFRNFRRVSALYCMV